MKRSGARIRFSTLPPNSSVRRLERGERNWRARLECPNCSSTPSKPPSRTWTALRAK